MSRHNSLIAKRYAKALFVAARNAKKLDEVEGQINSLNEIIASNNDLKNFLANPVFLRDQKSSVIEKLADKLKIHKITKYFFLVLAINGRTDYFTDITKEFLSLCTEHRGEIAAEVISAFELKKEQLEELKGNLEKSLNKKVILDPRIDQSILGGLIVKIGSKMYDDSLSYKLQKIEFLAKEAIVVNF